MAKYSFEFKKRIVQEYLTGNCGYVYLAKKYDVPAISDIKKWVENYNAFGDEGLLRSRKNQTYSFDFKYHVVKLYLDPFMDLCNREILSYKISPVPSAKSIMDALNTAIEITADCPYRRTFHSDQGWGYQMKAYVHTLQEQRIFQSMSRKGNCHDNSVMENFFGIMRQEMYYDEVYYSYEELKEAIVKYIEYYNKQRIKEKLGWMSPVEYRLKLLAA